MTNTRLNRKTQAALTFLWALGLVFLVPFDLVAESDSAAGIDHWRLNGLVETARVHRDGAPFWQVAHGNDRIRAGSNLEIPGQGGLIRHDIGAVTALKSSRIRIPSGDDEPRLEHVQGSARYNINRSLQERFQVQTPELSLSTPGAVFEMTVDVLGTEVNVIEGSADVATKNGLSEVRLDAGQSARVASTDLARLEIRKRSESNFIVVSLRRGGSSDDDAGIADSEDRASSRDEDEDVSSTGSSNADAENNDRGGSGKGKDGGSGNDDGRGADSGKGKNGRQGHRRRQG